MRPTSPEYERKLARLAELTETLGRRRAGELTLVGSGAPDGAAAAAGADEQEFVQLMRETLQDVADDRIRYDPHS